MKKILLFVVIFMSLKATAQSDSETVYIHKDPRINLLIKKQAQINEETTRNSRRTAPGYRIQIITTTDRNDAIDAKARVYKLYPELKAYMLYQSPYYRIKVGNFKTRGDAEDYHNSLSRDFPNSAFIVRDIIEVKPEPEIIE